MSKHISPEKQAEIREFLERLMADKMTTYEIAERFDVSQSTIMRLRKNPDTIQGRHVAEVETRKKPKPRKRSKGSLLSKEDREWFRDECT